MAKVNPYSDTLRKRPKVNLGDTPFWNAFTILSRSRPIGWGVGAIPFQDLSTYVRFHWRGDPEDFWDVIVPLDDYYLDKAVKK